MLGSTRYIIALDRMLERLGEPVTLRRTATSAPTTADVTVRGVVRGSHPDEMAGGINQYDSSIVLADRPIAVAGWPGPPEAGDRVVVRGRVRHVQAVETVAIGAVSIRHNLTVRG